MTRQKTEHRLHELFEVGVLLKGLNAFAELILGTLLLFVDVRGITLWLAERELVEDPDDFLATHLQAIAGHITAGGELYAALYLLSHGIIKGVLVIGLLREKLWAFPASLAVLALFVAYQTITLIHTHSIALAALTLFDLALMWLVYHEYRERKRSLGV